MMKFAAAHGLYAQSATSSAKHGWGDFLRSVRQVPPAVVPEPPRARCPGCGVVEAIRPLAPVGGVAAGYEFSVRLRDGSIRTSTTPSPTSWRVGDRIILIGGDAS